MRRYSGRHRLLDRYLAELIDDVGEPKRDGLWPPAVPSVVFTESITGRQRGDANINRFLKTCDIIDEVPERLARRAGALRTLARQGSAVDAIVVALAEPGGAGSEGVEWPLPTPRSAAASADAIQDGLPARGGAYGRIDVRCTIPCPCSHSPRWPRSAGPGWCGRPDRFDLAGAAICLVGVAVIMYAPR